MTLTLDFRAPRSPEVVDALTRREFIVGGLASGLLLAACGDGGDDAASPGPETTPASVTRSFVDVTGNEIEVPAEPQRIVAIHDSNGGEQILSLGYKVVGFPSRGGSFSPEIAAGYDLEGFADVGEVYEPNIEAIAALRPDLIVGEGYDGKGMDQFMSEGAQAQLDAIAPVVYINTFRPVDEVMADFAELLGPRAVEELERQRSEYEQALAELGQELGDPAGLVVSIVQMNAGDQVTVHGDETLVPSVILDSLDIARPPVTEEADAAGGFLPLSLERIPEVDADLILLDKGVGEFGADYTSNPLWQGLDAVEAGQVHVYDASWYGTTYQRFQLVLDELGPRLLDSDREVFA